MKKREFFIIALLILSLWANFTALKTIEQQTNRIDDIRTSMTQLTHQLTVARNQIDQVVAEKAWIQKTNFNLVKEDSHDDRMVVRSEFTFNAMRANQQPIFFHREKGTTDWAKNVLESQGGLNYALTITLSPEKLYEYQITAEGDVLMGSTILTIPQKIYGYPEKKVDLSMSPVKNSSNFSAQVYVGFAPAPIDEMTPVKVSLLIENNGQLIKTIPLTNKSNLGSEFGGSLEITSEDKMDMSSNSEHYIVTEYKNGAVIKEKTNVIQHEGNQASQRITYEEKR